MEPNEKILISESEILEMLAQSFDEGFSGYQEIKSGIVKKIFNKFLNKYKKNIGNKPKAVEYSDTAGAGLSTIGTFYSGPVGFSGSTFSQPASASVDNGWYVESVSSSVSNSGWRGESVSNSSSNSEWRGDPVQIIGDPVQIFANGASTFTRSESAPISNNTLSDTRSAQNTPNNTNTNYINHVQPANPVFPTMTNYYTSGTVSADGSWQNSSTQSI